MTKIDKNKLKISHRNGSGLAKMLLVMVLVGVILSSFVSGLTKIEYYEIESSTYFHTTSTRNVGQTFTTGNLQPMGANTTLKIISINATAALVSGSGLMNVSLYATSGGLPIGSPLSINSSVNVYNIDSVNYKWFNITMPDYTLSDGTMYAIVLERVELGTEVRWAVKGSGNSYGGGSCLDANPNWALCTGGTQDAMFQVWTGESISPTIYINLLQPGNGVSILDNANFSANYTSSILNLTNATYYVWNSSGIFNQTKVDITGIVNSSLLSINGFTPGDYSWNVLACNGNSTFSNCSFAISNYTFTSGFIFETGQIYTPIAIETSFETFSINITYITSYWSSIAASLFYNGTFYSGTAGGSGNTRIFNRTIQLPSVFESTNKTFYWQIALTNVTGTYYFNSSFNNQTITPIGFGICGGSLNIVVLNFTAKNETNLASVDGFNFAGTFEVWKTGGGLFKTNSTTSLTGVNSVALCISTNTTYYVNADIDYSASGFSQRSYYLRNAQVSNITNNISLYLLDSGLSTSIIINIQDRFLTNLKNHLVKVLRYYPGNGVYYLVETAKTDDFGNALIKAQEENVDYRFQIENSTGSNIYSSNSMRIICTGTPCTLSFVTGTADKITQNLIDFNNIQYSLTWNNNTGYVLFEFSDSTGLTQSMRLLVTKINSYGETIICDNTITGASGISSCSIGVNATGTYLARVYRTASPATYFDELSISLTNVWQTFGTEGLVWMFMFIVVMFFTGLAIGPAAAGIMSVVSIIFMMATGIVYMPFVVMLSIVVVVVIFIIKMRS